MTASIRAYREEDGAAVAEFLTSAAARDVTLEPITAEAWWRFVTRSFNRGAKDFAVAVQDTRVVAVLMSTRYEESGEQGRMLRNFRIIVDPDHRRRGIATRLLRRVYGQEPATDPLEASTMGKWVAATRLLEREGFGVVRRTLWMSIDRPTSPPAPPEGVSLRPDRADAADDAVWQRLNDEGYAGGPDHSPLTPQDLAVMRQADRFHLWLAEANGEAVGLCHTNDFAGKGCVNSVVVSPRFRGRGLGRALLLAGMESLRAAGAGVIRLNVLEHNTHAVTLYRSVGFGTDDEILTWQKSATPPRASGAASP